MTVRNLKNSFRPASTAEATLYTADTNSQGVLITHFAAHNDTTTAAMYSVKIYPSSGASYSLVPMKVLNRLRYEVPESVVGAVIPPGGRLAVQVSVANTIAFTVAGDV